MTVVNQPSRKGAAEVALQLRKRIEDFTLAQNERLASERVLSEEFGVSRGTIREALNKLAAAGLVEIKPGSGTYVTHEPVDDAKYIISNARPLELIDTRFALEPHICRLVVLNGREADFAKLEELIEKMEASTHDPKAFSEIDTAFHSALAEATGNSLLIWIIGQIKDVRGQEQWAQMRRLTLGPQIIVAYNRQHRAILDAIRSRDPEQAASQMKAHLETARQSLMRSAEA